MRVAAGDRRRHEYLVYAHREDSEWHQVSYERLTDLAERSVAWAIPWPCIHEFLAIVTHPKVFAPPTPSQKALEQVDAWIESPSLVLLAESQAHWEQLRRLLVSSKVAGPRVHDARSGLVHTTASRNSGPPTAILDVSPL